MPGRECHHCRQWVEEGEAHDCWTTTEAALTADLSEDLRDAWERLRETAAGFGDQRIYASHNSIMFSRKACYFFVRPKRKHLELCIFLGRTERAAQVKRAVQSSKSKIAHIVHVMHRDQIEAPITDWLQEAYDYGGRAAAEQSVEGAVPRRAALTKKEKQKKSPARGVRQTTKRRSSRR
ncbi:MAG TPA: DUF5655 domain-containing protein [Vicinamibacterales bacterium]|nr:DUF5655 domain-containing protein [Vicinamibacterales bacterium]